MALLEMLLALMYKQQNNGLSGKKGIEHLMWPSLHLNDVHRNALSSTDLLVSASSFLFIGAQGVKLTYKSRARERDSSFLNNKLHPLVFFCLFKWEITPKLSFFNNLSSGSS